MLNPTEIIRPNTKTSVGNATSFFLDPLGWKFGAGNSTLPLLLNSAWKFHWLFLQNRVYSYLPLETPTISSILPPPPPITPLTSPSFPCLVFFWISPTNGVGLVRQVQLAVEDASYLDPYLIFTCITIYFVPFTTNINLQNLAHKNLLALKLKLTNFSNEISWSSFFSDIPLNRKMAPASDWLFFCSSSVELKNNSRKVFRNWHAQIFEKCCTRFYLDWRGRRRVERRKLFLPDVYWIECFHWIFPLLAKFFRSQFWIIILYPRLLRLYIQSNDIIKDIKSRSHLAI